MFGAAMQPVAPVPTEAQLVCTELAKRMGELMPILARAGGQAQPQPPGVAPTSSLQQGFVAYSYSFSENPQLIQQGNSGPFNPAVHVDYNKWVQAVQNNPDPRCCYPEPLVGLPALEQRIGKQQAAMTECTNALDGLRGGFDNLKDHLNAQSLQKLEECQRRHQQLSRQLLQVVSAVETYAVMNGAARRNPHVEAQLEERFARLEDAVHAPASARARVEELWVVLRGLLQRGGAPAGGPSRITESEANRALQVTAAQGELLEALQEEVSHRKRDVSQFEGALARFSTTGSICSGSAGAMLGPHSSTL